MVTSKSGRSGILLGMNILPDTSPRSRRDRVGRPDLEDDGAQALNRHWKSIILSFGCFGSTATNIHQRGAQHASHETAAFAFLPTNDHDHGAFCDQDTHHRLRSPPGAASATGASALVFASQRTTRVRPHFPAVIHSTPRKRPKRKLGRDHSPSPATEKVDANN